MFTNGCHSKEFVLEAAATLRPYKIRNGTIQEDNTLLGITPPSEESLKYIWAKSLGERLTLVH
jgi:hypothetical protein